MDARPEHECDLCEHPNYQTLIDDAGRFVRHVHVRGRAEFELSEQDQDFLDKL